MQWGSQKKVAWSDAAKGKKKRSVSESKTHWKKTHWNLGNWKG